jgi:archaellum component FlaF (FlaF/FlaG flagellin family)
MGLSNEAAIALLAFIVYLPTVFLAFFQIYKYISRMNARRFRAEGTVAPQWRSLNQVLLFVPMHYTSIRSIINEIYHKEHES